MEIFSISTNKLSRINKATQMCKEDMLPKAKQESTTNMVSKVHDTRTHFQHPNKTCRYFNQSVYQHHSKQKTIDLYSKKY